MASFKKELKAALSRFDAAHEAFTEGTTLQKKNKKKLKSAKAKIKSLEQKVASLEQQLEVVRDDHATLAGAMPAAAGTEPKETTGKKAGRRRNATAKSKANKSSKAEDTSAGEMAEAVSEAPESVSAAAAETPAPKPRRGRPRKTTGAAKSARKSTRATKTKTKAAAKSKAAPKAKGTGRRGRPSTKGPESELTKIHGVGATMAKRFEESGVTTVQEFANLSDDAMSEVLQQCGPRYRNADHDKMEGYREAARNAMEG